VPLLGTAWAEYAERNSVEHLIGGKSMKAYVLINASPGRALEVAKKMEGVTGISAADAITGEYDVIAVCEAPDVNSIGSLIVDKIQKIDGVFKTITCLAVK
jgi:DNA-binding Lrp family transcriptional regulator